MASLRMRLIILTLAWVTLLGIHSACAENSPFSVRTTADLYTALSDPDVTSVLLNDTLAINQKDWARTVNISRTVIISATPERLAARIYVLLDFKNVAMMFQLAPNITLTFRGLELVNHYDTVGPTFRPLRLSVGATALFVNCVQRRRAGLPYKAALVNMVEASRPAGVGGSQVCLLVTNLTYSSTRNLSAPIYYSEAINMSDYSTTVTPDSSLAYQNLFYGGYTYTIWANYYVVDHTVSDECMAQRPGTECVTLLLQQLDGVGAGAVTGVPPGQAGSAVYAGAGGSDAEEAKNRKVIIGVVVPVAVVLLAAVVTAVALQQRRSRRRRRSQLDSEQPGALGGGDLEGGGVGGGKGRVPSSLARGHDRGCVFLGLEENQQLPEWSPLAADVMAEEDGEDEDQGHKRIGGFGGAAGGISQVTGDTDMLPSPLLGGRGGDGGGGGGASGAGGSNLQQPSASDGAAGSGLLRPAVSSSVDGGGGAASGAAAEEGGAGGGAAAAAGSGRQAAGSGPTSSDRGGGRSGSDMHSELGRMAQELRATVRDQAIRLEAIIGCGSFGTVYKGTWQGLPVAVKTLVFSASDDNRRRALQEAALCVSISHPNVVATYSSELQPLGTLGVGPRSNTSAGAADAGGGGGLAGPDSGGNPGEKELSQILEWRLYIVQEFADGGPLRKLYGNKSLWPSPGVVNLPAVVGLALGIAKALSHLHAKRIIHGDLNPNNVLLKRDAAEPSGFVVKVGDFGLSVMLPQNRTHLSNLRMGTMFYMCPAVVMKGQVGPPSDVFSLGVMLWELYHGRRAGIRTDQGPRYSSIFPAFPPTCPEPYRAVALHCLQRQPQNRPSAALVELHLERLLGALTSVAAAPQPPRSAVSPPPGGSGAAAAAAGSAAIGSTWVDDMSNTLSGSETLPPTQFHIGA